MVAPQGYTLAYCLFTGAYLLSLIPIGGSSYNHRSDGPHLGHGLQRDEQIFFDEYGNEMEDYDYQYPDSFDYDSYSFSSAASEKKATVKRPKTAPLLKRSQARSMDGSNQRPRNVGM